MPARTHKSQRRMKDWVGLTGAEDWTSSDANELIRAVAPRNFHQDFPNEEVIEAQSTLLRIRGWIHIDPITDDGELMGDIFIIRQPQSGAISSPPTINNEFLSQQDILGHGFVAAQDGGYQVPWEVDIKAKRIMHPDDELTMVWGVSSGGSAASLKYRLRVLFSLP